MIRLPEQPGVLGMNLHSLVNEKGARHPAKGDSDRFPIETDSPTIIPVPGDPTTEREGAHRQIGYECRHT